MQSVNFNGFIHTSTIFNHSHKNKDLNSKVNDTLKEYGAEVILSTYKPSSEDNYKWTDDDAQVSFATDFLAYLPGDSNKDIEALKKLRELNVTASYTNKKDYVGQAASPEVIKKTLEIWEKGLNE